MRIATTVLVFCVAALSALGLVMISSASIGLEHGRFLTSQSIWFCIALVVCLVAAGPDYGVLRKVAWPIYVIGLLALVAVFVPGVSREINGAKRWILYHGISYQPSEFAKLALIVGLAHYCASNQAQMRGFVRGFLLPGIMVVMMLGLIFPEPDWGTTVLLACVSGAMLLVAGSRPVFFWPTACLGLVGLVVGILHNSVRSTRVMAWLHPELYKDDKGYQAYQAMIALGSGGVTGMGLGEGRTKLGFMPEHHTDFIFAVVGEELGLVATLAVVIAFITLVVCGMIISWHARDNFGMILGSGLTFLLGFQAFINIGVVTGTLPNKGLALPFMSYGGSNLLTMAAVVGMLLNIARHSAGGAAQRVPSASFELNPFGEPG